MWWDGHNMGSNDWIGMTFAMVAFWTLLVVAVVAIRRDRTSRSSAAPHAGPTPLQTLDQRFARGEIDVDEYQTRLEALRAGM